MSDTYNFFATISRMKYINRWALMRNAREENLSEHSSEVAMIAHVLCVIGNVRYGKNLDVDKAALIGLYHDTSEIITGDMPTPVKYYNNDIRNSYKEIEAIAEGKLLGKLPADLRPYFESIYNPIDGRNGESDEQIESERYMRRLVKAADRISALIKCMEEKGAGNGEFRTAEVSIRESVEKIAGEMPEVRDFVEEFLPPYGKTLDELS